MEKYIFCFYTIYLGRNRIDIRNAFSTILSTIASLQLRDDTYKIF